MTNYTLHNKPRYSSLNRVDSKKNFKGTLKVVSYNIQHSKKIDKAIELLNTNSNLKDADVLLLQEMVPNAVKKISEALNYNYIYYPALLHPTLEQDFGNAILSKWPIIDDHKIILPQVKAKTRQRIAVGATLQIGEFRVKTYSLHFGILLKPSERKKMSDLIISTLPDDISYCIVGGDFNSFTKEDRKAIAQSFHDNGFLHASARVDWSYVHWYFLNTKVTLDHIYTKSFKVETSGKVSNRKSSDHAPIWTELEINSDRH